MKPENCLVLLDGMSLYVHLESGYYRVLRFLRVIKPTSVSLGA